MMRIFALAATLAVASLCAASPRLVVVISIDQYRADYADRFAAHHLPAESRGRVGGFEWLKQRGAWFADAHFSHVPTSTGPGHAAMLTGSVPAINGIVENNWFDRATGARVYCVEDPTVQTVGGRSKPMSPRNLLVTTLGDELKMATSGRARVVGIALKDRASILMAGHAADTVIWFDADAGAWATSTFYAPSGKLPAWVERLNARGIPASQLGDRWTPLLPDSAYASTRLAPFVTERRPRPIFSHSLEPGSRERFRNWTTSAAGQEFVFRSVAEAMEHERLGQDEVPDLLCVNLSTNDYVGHKFGPNSPEVMDISIRTDRLLSDLFNSLASKVKGGLAAVTVVVSADHGVMPIPEEARDIYRIPSVRIPDGTIEKVVESALVTEFGEGVGVAAFSAPHMYLRFGNAPRERVVEVARKACEGVPGVFAAIPAERVAEGRLPRLAWAQRVENGFYAPRSGDLLVLEAPGAYLGSGTGTGHGSPWAYDTHVPIFVAGYGVRAGVSYRTVSISDIAPTLSQILGVEYPSGCVGSPLGEAIRRAQ